jgi:hypothetical protein
MIAHQDGPTEGGPNEEGAPHEGLIAVAATAAAMALTAVSAASASAATCRTGTEVITGSTTNLAIITANTTVLPVRAHGVVSTRGTISLSGPSNGTPTGSGWMRRDTTSPACPTWGQQFRA